MNVIRSGMRRFRGQSLKNGVNGEHKKEKDLAETLSLDNASLMDDEDDFQSVASVDSYEVTRALRAPTRDCFCQTELTGPDKDGYHYVTARDGVVLRWRLLLGGPRGNHHLDARARTAICLHGLGDDISWWEDGVFSTKEPDAGAVSSAAADDDRREAAKAARKAREASAAAVAAAAWRWEPEDPTMAEVHRRLLAHQANPASVAWVAALKKEVELANEAEIGLQMLTHARLQKFIEREGELKKALPQGNHKQHIRVVFYLIGQADRTVQPMLEKLRDLGGISKLREMEAEAEATAKAEREAKAKEVGATTDEAEKKAAEAICAPEVDLFSLVPEQAEVELQTPGPPPDARHRARLVRELATHMNVILLDQRGFGASGRPQAVGKLKDSAITCMLTFRINDLSSFSKAIRFDNECCKKDAQNWSHTASVAGDIAIISVEYPRLSSLGKYLRSQEFRRPAQRFGSSGALLRAEVIGSAEAMKSASSFLGAEFTSAKQVCLLSRTTDALTADRLPGHTGSEVVIVHSFRLRSEESSADLERFCEQSLEEVRCDELCISFSLSRSGRRVQALGKFNGHLGALIHLQRLQKWMASTAQGTFGGCVEKCLSVQLHARSADIRALKASVGWEAASRHPIVQVLQVFPGSFHKGKVTSCAPTISDFVNDVQDVLSEAGVSRATIVGHSMGAAVALRTAVDFPNRVERLCTSAGAHRVGEAAKANWDGLAADIVGWNENAIRTTVSVVRIEDADIQSVQAPTLLINATDDSLTPVVGSELLKERLPHAELHTPDFGGHDCLVASNVPLERLVRFMLASEAMVFTDDSLFARMVFSPWNLFGDQSLIQYRQLGVALAAAHHAERQRRLLRRELREEELEDEALLDKSENASEVGPSTALIVHQHFSDDYQTLKERREARKARFQSIDATLQDALQKAGIDARASRGPRRGDYHSELVALLQTRMEAMKSHMTAPALDAVRGSEDWWCDDAAGYREGKLTADSWGRESLTDVSLSSWKSS